MEKVVYLPILDQNGTETDFRGAKGTPIGAGWTKRCSTMCGTAEQAISGHKKFNRLAGGVNIYPRNGLNLASEPSRGSLMVPSTSPD